MSDLTELKKPLLIAALLAAGACAIPAARATEAPADPCALLQAAQVSTIVGQPYGAPEKSVAPRPYMNTVQGTDCTFAARGSGASLLFRVYFDPTPAAATDLFSRLGFFYRPQTPVAGVGDEAYLDGVHGLHVRKGNVRYYLSFSHASGSGAAVDKQLRDMASAIAGKL